VKKRIRFLLSRPYFQWLGLLIRVRHNQQALSDLGYEGDWPTFSFGEDVSVSRVNISRMPGARFCKSIGIGPFFGKFYIDVKLYLAAKRRLKEQSRVGLSEKGCILIASKYNFEQYRSQIKEVYKPLLEMEKTGDGL